MKSETISQTVETEIKHKGKLIPHSTPTTIATSHKVKLSTTFKTWFCFGEFYFY